MVIKEKKKNFSFHGKQVIIKSDGKICKNSVELTKTELFKDIVCKYLKFLRERDSPLLDIFPEEMSNEEQGDTIITLLQKLSEFSKGKIIKEFSKFKYFFNDTYLLNRFVENLYNYWRSYERFFICYSNILQCLLHT